MPETKILPPDDLRRILKRAAGKEVTWQEIDLVKDHCAAMDERVKELERDRHVVAHELGCADDAGAYAAQVAMARIRELERLWAEESTARIRKLDLSTKDT